jgi:hypothetical protein
MYFGTNMTANVNNTVFAYSMHAWKSNQIK